MATKSLARAALWTATGFCGISAVCFAVNAGATLLNHPERTGELYGMATAAAIFAFLASHLREMLRDRGATQHAVPLIVEPAALPSSPPDWAVMRGQPADPAPVRVERDCPYCAERILVAARICKHCRSDVSAA